MMVDRRKSRRKKTRETAPRVPKESTLVCMFLVSQTCTCRAPGECRVLARSHTGTRSAMAKNGSARAFFLALWLVVGASFKYELNDMVDQAHTRYARFLFVLLFSDLLSLYAAEYTSIASHISCFSRDGSEVVDARLKFEWRGKYESCDCIPRWEART